jgi:hypothetical protein
MLAQAKQAPGLLLANCETGWPAGIRPCFRGVTSTSVMVGAGAKRPVSDGRSPLGG